ncbi:DUF4199 domain-containing protein [Chitinophaga barathri]|uniref:DUF4199 domain-containing protein n=1 Tax=Chitinophaga barathri TaxID=1647451 RepID=A0A3N4MA41_9BACT|nr:DUF4199 domain-containing protein [Chitinophaga barathri]RPD38546.1 DUF4199 domain-containing protein [Chitinophaga barathri]
MQQTIQSPRKLPWIYGVLIGLISILFTLFFYITQWISDLWTGYFVNTLIFVGVMVSVIHANKAYGGRASLGRLFMTGLLTAFVAVVMVSTANILFQLGTEPVMGTGENIPSDGARMNEYSDYKRQGYWIFTITSVFVTNAVLGALGALLGAVTVKRNQKTTDAK